MKCSIEGCPKPARTRTWCPMHYGRWRRNGDPLVAKRYASSPDEALEIRGERQGECLVWTGAVDGDGYGSVSVNGRIVGVHRYAYEREHGKLPTDIDVDHRCHNPACFELKHLRPATRAQNASHRRGASKSNRSTGVRNVLRRKNGFQVQVRHQGRAYGHFHVTIEAAEAEAIALRERLHGDFA